MSYAERLLARQDEVGRPVRVALVGAGQMGRGLAAQVGRMAGLQLSVDQAARVVDDGGSLTLATADAVARLPVDVVVDATGVPNVGAELTLASLLNGKDVVGLNVESDVTVGILFAQLARATGRVYTIARGDEPVETKKLVDFARDLNFEIICAAKGKNPKMLCEFVDGSKAMIEMASLANTTGLRVSTRGMHGPESTVPTLHETFKLTEDGGILERPGVVDYCTGPVAPGVFVVVRTAHAYVQHE